jgi:heme-degrading monooxygenase HmoA
MFDLIVTAEVRPAKRGEFVLSIRSLISAAPGLRGDLLIAASLNDENLLCCLAAWDSEQEFRGFLCSDAFRALRGALRTLAERSELRVLQRMEGTTGPGASP